MGDEGGSTVARALSEYEVEDILIKRLVDINYDFIKMTNYDDLKSNLREQICKVNAEKLIEAKGEAMLSDAEFSRILIHLEGPPSTTRPGFCASNTFLNSIMARKSTSISLLVTTLAIPIKLLTR